MRSFAVNGHPCFLILAGFALVIVISGCWMRGPAPSGDRWTSGSIPQLASDDGNPPQFNFVRWQQGLNLVIVDDFFGTEESSGNFYYYAGSKWTHDGARYEWRLDTTDGKTATFQINDKEYDLSEGTLFVIKANGDKVEMHQLNRDLCALPFDNAAISDFLKNDAEVRKIFGKRDVDK